MNCTWILCQHGEAKPSKHTGESVKRLCSSCRVLVLTDDCISVTGLDTVLTSEYRKSLLPHVRDIVAELRRKPCCSKS